MINAEINDFIDTVFYCILFYSAKKETGGLLPIIHNYMFFLEKKCICEDFQSGFRPYHSTCVVN